MNGLRLAWRVVYFPRQAVLEAERAPAGADAQLLRATTWLIVGLGLIQGALLCAARWQPALVRQSALAWIAVDPALTLPEAAGRVRFLAAAGIPWQVIAVAAACTFIAAVLWASGRLVGCPAGFLQFWRLAVLSEWIVTLGLAARYAVLFSRDLSGLADLRDVPLGLGLSLLPGFGWDDVGWLAYTFWRDFDVFGLWRWLFLAAGATWVTGRAEPGNFQGQAGTAAGNGMTRAQGAVAAGVALGALSFAGFLWTRFGPEGLAWLLRLGR